MNFARVSRRHLFSRTILAAILSIPVPVPAVESSLPAARDFSADSRTVTTTGMPLIVMLSLAGCPHCEVVRRSHLLPLFRNGPATQKPLIRQIEINGHDLVRDFSGRATTHAEFAGRYRFGIAPVVMFFDAKGEMIAAPLVGSMIPDFYGAYFDAALTEARSNLQAGRHSPRTIP